MIPISKSAEDYYDQFLGIPEVRRMFCDSKPSVDSILEGFLGKLEIRKNEIRSLNDSSTIRILVSKLDSSAKVVKSGAGIKIIGLEELSIKKEVFLKVFLNASDRKACSNRNVKIVLLGFLIGTLTDVMSVLDELVLLHNKFTGRMNANGIILTVAERLPLIEHRKYMVETYRKYDQEKTQQTSTSDVTYLLNNDVWVIYFRNAQRQLVRAVIHFALSGLVCAENGSVGKERDEEGEEHDFVIQNYNIFSLTGSCSLDSFHTLRIQLRSQDKTISIQGMLPFKKKQRNQNLSEIDIMSCSRLEHYFPYQGEKRMHASNGVMIKLKDGLPNDVLAGTLHDISQLTEFEREIAKYTSFSQQYTIENILNNNHLIKLVKSKVKSSTKRSFKNIVSRAESLTIKSRNRTHPLEETWVSLSRLRGRDDRLAVSYWSFSLDHMNYEIGVERDSFSRTLRGFMRECDNGLIWFEFNENEHDKPKFIFGSQEKLKIKTSFKVQSLDDEIEEFENEEIDEEFYVIKAYSSLVSKSEFSTSRELIFPIRLMPYEFVERYRFSMGYHGYRKIQIDPKYVSKVFSDGEDRHSITFDEFMSEKVRLGDKMKSFLLGDHTLGKSDKE